MHLLHEHLRRTAVVAGTAIVLFGGGSAAAAGGGALSTSNPLLRNDAHHFPAPAGPITSRAPVIVRVGGGFDWVDAAVGATVGFGLALVATGATVGLRRRVVVGGLR
ncbi:MAG: hypothetical protein QOE36_3253 [Gaiellaceae bacterium]|jgi:hypothetical protein|nr:hypothetical protein [Gaiellaceae bacterium]